MKLNDIVSVLTPMGEIVGRFLSDEDGRIHIGKPRMMIQANNGKVGFARGICFSGKPEPDDAFFYPGGVLAVVPTSDEISKAHTEFTSGIILQ